jgi:hypothetical protein
MCGSIAGPAEVVNSRELPGTCGRKVRQSGEASHQNEVRSARGDDSSDGGEKIARSSDVDSDLLVQARGREIESERETNGS